MPKNGKNLRKKLSLHVEWFNFLYFFFERTKLFTVCFGLRFLSMFRKTTKKKKFVKIYIARLVYKKKIPSQMRPVRRSFLYNYIKKLLKLNRLSRCESFPVKHVLAQKIRSHLDALKTAKNILNLS